MEDALTACKLTDWDAAQPLAVLAAAYAEIGDFEKAKKTIAQAVERSPFYDTWQLKIDANEPYRDYLIMNSAGADSPNEN